MSNEANKKNADQLKYIIGLVVSITALFVSASTSYFANENLKTAQQHNKLSVEPLLRVTPMMAGDTGKNGLFVSNMGLGPAIVKNFSVVANDTMYDGFSEDHWPTILQSMGINPACFATGWPNLDSVVRPREEPLPLLYLSKVDSVCMPEMVKLVGGKEIMIKFEYQTIYQERREETSTSKIKSKSIDALYQRITGQSN